MKNNETAIAPYRDQDELVDDLVRALRARVRAAIDNLALLGGDDACQDEWPANVLESEALINARVHVTVDQQRFPLIQLRDRFGLSQTEERCLWMFIANELCPLTRTLIRQVATEETADPTTDTLRRIVYSHGYSRRIWRELSEQGTLRRFGFIERSDTGLEIPEHRRTWKVASRILALVHGDLRIDESLSTIAAVDTTAPALGDLLYSGDVVQRVEAAFDRQVVVIVHGRPGQGRRSLLTAVAASRGLGLLRIRGRSLSRDPNTAQMQLRFIRRECALLDLTPLICDFDALAGDGDAADRIDLVEQELTGLVLATSNRQLARRWTKPPVAVELQSPTGAQRAVIWRRALPMASQEDAEILATMYPLAPALIEAAGQSAIEQSGSTTVTPEHIRVGLRNVLDDRLAGLATRATVNQTWNDLVLPDDQITALVELLARIRERRRVYEEWGFADKIGRGLGVSALFSGPPGTGKTMAAGLVARSLNTELYQVDLSKIVSKWIGETEKNLAALFDAAEAGHAVLLFDEADALFAKRTEVRSSNDRFANQEVNFLLQRLESYTGVCILTTNQENAIDEAFRRRLSVHVRFPMPESEERQKLWQALIPSNAPVIGDLRFSHLASTYVMSGGYIKNAVLRAAFLAADEKGGIDAARLARAAQLEYEAMGKVVASHRP